VTTTAPNPAASRAIGRLIEPGSDVACAACGQPVRFAAKLGLRQVIANVYVDGRWDRVEHFHDECYDDHGAPYGPADRSSPVRRRV
jgi:hypothetical protein